MKFEFYCFVLMKSIFHITFIQIQSTTLLHIYGMYSHHHQQQDKQKIKQKSLISIPFWTLIYTCQKRIMMNANLRRWYHFTSEILENTVKGFVNRTMLRFTEQYTLPSTNIRVQHTEQVFTQKRFPSLCKKGNAQQYYIATTP